MSNLQPNSRLSIYFVLGNKILEMPMERDQISILFRNKGIFILQITKNNRILEVKKVILH